MAFITRDEALYAARRDLGQLNLAEAELRKSARAPSGERFDIFLSHSSEDAAVIAGIKALLEEEGLRVYVDWLEDPQLDRSHVTPATADVLRTRLDHSGFLLYASSRAASNSKWMPWELGYFDGRRRNRVGILPIVDSSQRGFAGVEYLGLYPVIERFDFTGIGRRFGRDTGPGTADRLKSLARS